MTHATLEDTFYDDPKWEAIARALGILDVPGAITADGIIRGLYATALSYCTRHAVDGIFEDAYLVARAFGWRGNPDRFLAVLIRYGVIEETELGLELHGWMSRCPKFEKAKQKRARRIERKGELRAARQSPMGPPPATDDIPVGHSYELFESLVVRSSIETDSPTERSSPNEESCTDRSSRGSDLRSDLKRSDLKITVDRAREMIVQDDARSVALVQVIEEDIAQVVDIDGPASMEFVAEEWNRYADASDGLLPEPRLSEESKLALDRTVVAGAWPRSRVRRYIARVAASPWCRGEVYDPHCVRWGLPHAFATPAIIHKVEVGTYDPRASRAPPGRDRARMTAAERQIAAGKALLLEMERQEQEGVS